MKLNGNTLHAVENLHRPDPFYTLPQNPLRADAFTMDDNEKILRIEDKVSDIIEILGLDQSDDSMSETPKRVAKMYVNEIFRGLNPRNKPEITIFENKYHYHSPLMELNIPFTSFCEHHFVPIEGIANVAYIPEDVVIGLSKIHRLVDYFARRPQVQERLTMQIFQELSTTVRTRSIGVVLKATHSCIACRGVNDKGSATVTSVFEGQIKENHQVMATLIGSH